MMLLPSVQPFCFIFYFRPGDQLGNLDLSNPLPGRKRVSEEASRTGARGVSGNVYIYTTHLTWFQIQSFNEVLVYRWYKVQ